MYNPLVALLNEVRYEPSEDELICLGDYIDRGPDSRKVVEFFMELKKHHGSRVTLLMGNHEDMCLQAHKDGMLDERNMLWRFNGCEATLASWGGKVPPEALTFMGSMLFYHENDDMIFVHGGVVPELPLKDTDPYDLLWSRNSAPHFSGKIVVVGHTIRSEGVTFDANSNTLSIDTGAFFATMGMPGRLSVVDLTNRMVYFVRTDTGKTGRKELHGKMGSWSR
jgi:serine/threonine protein phosphatase 1